MMSLSCVPPDFIAVDVKQTTPPLALNIGVEKPAAETGQRPQRASRGFNLGRINNSTAWILAVLVSLALISKGFFHF